ncbi:MAG: hypothetical protein H7145_19410 [Akkermansiaceae bacterium]|nr:hypothetical protein [Armatimonadota bacterium]
MLRPWLTEFVKPDRPAVVPDKVNRVVALWAFRLAAEVGVRMLPHGSYAA